MADDVTILPAAPLDAQALISKAIEHNMPVDTMERLLALRERLRDEQARTAFFAALAAFQGECPIIEKKKAITIRPSTGAPFTYHYAPLDVIVAQVGPLLTRHGLSYTMKPRQTETHLTAVCVVHHVAGHSEPSEVTVPIDKGARMGEAQKVGAASTYAARYAFCAAFGILTGDEDTDGGEPFKHNPFPPPPVKEPRSPFWNAEHVPEVTPSVREAQEKAGPTDIAAKQLEGTTDFAKAQIADMPDPSEPTQIELKQMDQIHARLRALAASDADPKKRFDTLRQKLKDKAGKELSVEHLNLLNPEQFRVIMSWLDAAQKMQRPSAKEVRRG